MAQFNEYEHPRNEDGTFKAILKSNKEYKSKIPIPDIGKVYRQNASCKEIIENKYNSELSKSQTTNYFKEKKEQEIVDFVENFRKGKITKTRIVIGNVSERERKALEELTGDKINATTHTLHVNELQHIENRHGNKGQHDKTMSDIEAYKNIPNVIKNFDYVEFVYEKNNIKTTNAYLNKQGKSSQLVRYVKKENNNNSYVVEAITDTKRGDLSIISAYSKKIER